MTLDVADAALLPHVVAKCLLAVAVLQLLLAAHVLQQLLHQQQLQLSTATWLQCHPLHQSLIQVHTCKTTDVSFKLLATLAKLYA